MQLIYFLFFIHYQSTIVLSTYDLWSIVFTLKQLVDIFEFRGRDVFQIGGEIVREARRKLSVFLSKNFNLKNSPDLQIKPNQKLTPKQSPQNGPL